MKKLLATLMSVLFVGMTVPFIGCDIGGEDGDNAVFDYSLSNDGTFYSISPKGDYTGEELVIPSEYDGKPVGAVDGFRSSNNLKKVVIPDSVTMIMADAFARCYALEEVVFGENVEYIGHQAFLYNTALTDIVFPDALTTIEHSAFEHCRDLMTVELGKNLQDVKNGAFGDCPRLVEVFNRSSLRISPGDVEAGNVAYYAKHVYNEAGESRLTVDDDGFVLYRDGELVSVVAYRGTETKIEIPNDVTEINGSAFLSQQNIESVIVPDSVLHIGREAFDSCFNLLNISIGKSVVSIRERAFAGCKLTSLVIPASVKWLGKDLFYEAKQIASIAFEDPNGWVVGYAQFKTNEEYASRYTEKKITGGKTIDSSLLEENAVKELTFNYSEREWQKIS